MSALDIRAATEYFTYDGTPSYDFKCLVFPRDVDTSPVKDYTVESVPGRSGDILLYNKRFQNVAHTYDCIIYEDFDLNYNELRSFLLSRDGYCRLTDTIHPDEFYHAYIGDAIQPRITRDRDMGKFTLTFMRKPQRWLTSGESEYTVRSDGNWVSNGQITNPTRFPCYPLLYFWGSSLSSGFDVLMSNNPHATSYYYNSTEITLANVDATTYSYINTYGLYIDMETLMVYNSQKRGTTPETSSLFSYNAYVTYTPGTSCKYPYRLAPGTNDFDPGTTSPGITNVTEIKVKPRWYRI